MPNMSVARAAELLKVSRQRIYKLLQGEEWPPILAVRMQRHSGGLVRALEISPKLRELVQEMEEAGFASFDGLRGVSEPEGQDGA